MPPDGAQPSAPPLRGVYLRPLPDALVPARHSAGARVRAAQLQAFLRPLHELALERLPLHGTLTLSVVGPSDWRRVCRYPYGFAFTRSRPTPATLAGAAGPSVDLVIPADHPGRLLRRFDEVLLRAARAGVRPPAPQGSIAAGTNLPVDDARAVSKRHVSSVPTPVAPNASPVAGNVAAVTPNATPVAPNAAPVAGNAAPVAPSDARDSASGGASGVARGPGVAEAPAPSGDVRELLDLIVGHEWGHAAASLAGLRLRVTWLDELLATVIYFAALRSAGADSVAQRVLAWAAVQAAGGDDTRRDLGAFEYPRGRLRLERSTYFQGVFTLRAWELVAGEDREPWDFVQSLHAAVAPVAGAGGRHRGDVARALVEVEPSFKEWFATLGSESS